MAYVHVEHMLSVELHISNNNFLGNCVLDKYQGTLTGAGASWACAVRASACESNS